MNTVTLPTPTISTPRGYRGEKSRSRNITYDIAGTTVTTAKGTERMAVQITVGHLGNSKSFYAVANQVTIASETDSIFTSVAYFPFDGVTLQRRPVARYSEKALDAFLAEVLAVFPDLVEGTPKLAAMFTKTDGEKP